MHLLWQSFFGMFCSIFFITFLLNNDNAFNYVMNNFAYGANAVVVAPYYFAIGYFFQIVFCYFNVFANFSGARIAKL
jgi:hypothetical protein